MRFHWPSFLLGFGGGLAASAVRERLRPLLLELVTLGFRTADAFAARVVMTREDFEDLIAEARARARTLFAQPELQ